MYTSATDKRRSHLPHCVWEMCFAAFLALFGAVYEHFSFGVWSAYMVYGFVFPFAAGLVLLFMELKGSQPGTLFLMLLHMASATLGVGAAAAGAVAIYGTENRLLKIYPIAGGALIAAAVMALAYERLKKSLLPSKEAVSAGSE